MAAWAAADEDDQRPRSRPGTAAARAARPARTRRRRPAAAPRSSGRRSAAARRRRRARSRRTGTTAATSRTPISRRSPARPIATWPGEPGGGVDAAEGHQHEREREDDVLERRRAGDRRRIGQHLGLEQQRQAEREQQQLQDEVAEHEHRRALVAPRPAAADRREGDVEHDRAGDQELADALVEAAPRTARGSPWRRTRRARPGSGSRGRSPSRR